MLSALAQQKADIEPELQQANAFYAEGRVEEAKATYLAALAKDPTHFTALNNFGTLCLETGYRSAARTLYEEALRHHPGNRVAHVNFANLRYSDGNLAAALLHYTAALRLDVNCIEAHRGMGNVLADLGQEEAAETHRSFAYSQQPVIPMRFTGKKPGVKLLILFAATGGNIPTKPLIDQQKFEVTTVAADFFDPAQDLPPHTLIFNAAGDADRSVKALQRAELLLTRTTAPVINHPSAVLTTNRAAIAARFSGWPGIVTPRTVTLAKDGFLPENLEKTLAEHALGFPFLLRAPGFHTGQYFLKIDTPSDLDAALADLPGSQIMAIEYLEARGADGLYRKYRTMMIGGVLYPLHLALSRNWKVHYFSADMAEAPLHRAEEEAFLADMPGVLGPSVMAGLEAITRELCLDYGGMDFAVSANGEILLFETNATMVIVEPDSDPRWAYRRAPFLHVRDAVYDMLNSRLAPIPEL